MADIEIVRLTAEDATGGAFASINRSLSSLQASAVGVKSAFAALGAISSVGVLVNMARSAIDAADNLNKLSQRVGVSVENLSKLQYAAKLSDISTDQLGDGLKKLAVNLQAAGRGSGDALEAFRALGFAQKELLNLSPDQALNRIAQAFEGIEDGAGKTALAVQLFGRSGSDLIPLLNQGSAGLKAMADEATRFGLVVTTEAAQAAERFNDNLTRLGETARVFGVQIANTALPSLNKFTEQLLESRRIFGSFGSAFVNIGIKIDPFKSLGENIAKTRQEIERLQAQLNNIPASGSRLRADVAGQLDVAKKQLEFLKFQQRQEIETGGAGNQDARDRALAGAAPGKRKAPVIASSSDLAARKREQEQLKRLELQNAQEIDRIVTEARREFDQSQFRLSQESQQRSDKAALDQANKFAADLNGILAQTTGGKLQEIERQQGVLNDALISGKINAEQFAEAFKVLDDERNRALGRSGDSFQKLADDGKAALKDLQFAVEGWGRKFTDTLATAVETGKLDFRSLAQSIIGDLLRMTIQAQITIPLFKAIGGATGFFAKGGVFGPSGQLTAFASGGVVTQPTMFAFGNGTGLMGEAGPEAIMPLKRGAGGRLGVEASGGFGNISVYIDSRTDRAEVEALARRGVEQGLAKDREERRRGRV